MQFYDTPRNVREAIECPPPNPLGNYDYPTAGKNDNSEEKNHKMPFFQNPLGNYAFLQICEMFRLMIEPELILSSRPQFINDLSRRILIFYNTLQAHFLFSENLVDVS